MKFLYFKYCILLFLLFSFANCTSRFIEGPAGKVDANGATLQERLEQKRKIDSVLDQVDRGAKKIKRVYSLFKSIQNPSSDYDAYTPIDFIIDINKELKDRIPRNENGKYIREGEFILPLSISSPNCNKVKTLLVSEPIKGPKGEKIGEGVEYSLKPCEDDAEYLSVISATWAYSSLNFNIQSSNLMAIISKILSSTLKDKLENIEIGNSECSVKLGTNQILESIICSSIDIQITKSETAIINVIKFSNSGEFRLTVDAELFENNRKKSNIQFRLNRDGKFETGPYRGLETK